MPRVRLPADPHGRRNALSTFSKARPWPAAGYRHAQGRFEARLGLKSDRMIETSLALSGSKERYDRKIDAALIVALTPAGMEEIRVMTGTQPAASKP